LPNRTFRVAGGRFEMTSSFAPLRNIQDIEEFERVPLAQRIVSWDANVWLRQGLDLAPDKPAIRYIHDGNPESAPVVVTYAKLKRSAIHAANLFHALGVRPDDAVLFLLPTIPQLYTVMLGSLSAGIACCVNWMLEPEHWVELIRESRAKVVVALGPTPGFEIWDKLQSVHSQIPDTVRVLSVQGPGGELLADSDFASQASQQPGDALTFERAAQPDDVAAYVHSGGTTGSPKLVRLTHRGLCYKFWANTLVMAHTADDVIFSDYPMFHIAGFFGRGLLPVADGMAIVIPSPHGARDKRFIENYWKFVQKFRISVFSGVPTTLATLSKHPPRGEDLRSLRPYGVTGSTAFPSEIARQLESLIGVRMLGSYGETEYTQNVAQPPRDGEPRYGSAGLRLPYTQIRIAELDADGNIVRDCAADEIGVVLVKGPSVTPGYVNAKYNAGIFTPDGWFNSGDLGRIDGDGYLWLTGRVKDVIIRGGHNIDPSVIEETLLKHPEVLLAAAVSKPDSYAGELPVAYVQLTGSAKVTADELRDFAQAHIPERAAAPKEIILVERMPLTDIGKPAKVKLRLDAARRAFTADLAGIAGGNAHITVDMVADAQKGNLAVITVDNADGERRTDIEARIRERMKYYPTPFAITWGQPGEQTIV
jgi:fatty-acyl-CoA synthase